MRVDNIPSPGALSQGLQLRTVAARAISAIEVQADLYTGGKAPGAAQLSAFFAACKTAVDLKLDTTLPTITARQISAATPGSIILTFSEILDATVVPAPSAFTIANPAKTVTGVAVSGNKVYMNVNTPFVAGDTAATIAYVVPGTNSLRDLSANPVAASAATVIARVA